MWFTLQRFVFLEEGTKKFDAFTRENYMLQFAVEESQLKHKYSSSIIKHRKPYMNEKCHLQTGL